MKLDTVAHSFSFLNKKDKQKLKSIPLVNDHGRLKLSWKKIRLQEYSSQQIWRNSTIVKEIVIFIVKTEPV